MKKLALLLIPVVALAALAFLGSSGGPSGGVRSAPDFAKLDANAAYGVQIHWSGVSVPSGTGFYVCQGTSGPISSCTSGSSVAQPTSSPYTAGGLACGTTYNFAVVAHDASSGVSAPFQTVWSTPACPGTSPFPLQVSGNGHFLENASGQPWLLVGDSPQSVMGNLSVSKAAAYFADRESQGFNAVWINLLCESYTACNADGLAYNNATSTADNLAPFTAGSNSAGWTFGTGTCGDCASAYFAQAQTEVAQANTDGIAVFLDPIPTDACSDTGAGKLINTITGNGDGTVSTTDADYRYGEYLGTEFNKATYPNVVWQLGNDFTCYTTSADDADVLSIANGIEATDSGSLMTNEICTTAMCGGGGSAEEGFTSLDDTTHDWTGRVTINEAYAYAPTYAENQRAYGQTPTMPMIQGEANYEGQQNSGTDGCGAGPAGDTTARLCRLQDWWTMTTGATGQLYGGPCYGITNSTTLSSCDTAGATQLDNQETFLKNIRWWTLAPDTNGAGHLVTSGGGSCPTTGLFAAVTCVTAATNEAQGDNLALIYMPNPSTLGTITVDLTKLSGTPIATWVDPADDAETTATHGGTSSAATFTPTGDNSVGDKDWVLLLQS